MTNHRSEAGVTTSAVVRDSVSPALGETATAEFSRCRTYRYALTRTWDIRLPPATFVLLNPSTADAFVVDPTVRRCLGFARDWGCGALLVLNAFALRSTDPKGLYRHPDPVGPANDEVIAGWAPHMTGPVIVGWGVNGSHRGRGPAVARLLADRGVTVRCLGTTLDGHPRHPLYLRCDLRPITWRQP
jgi:hypothetical protein